MTTHSEGDLQLLPIWIFQSALYGVQGWLSNLKVSIDLHKEDLNVRIVPDSSKSYSRESKGNERLSDQAGGDFDKSWQSAVSIVGLPFAQLRRSI